MGGFLTHSRPKLASGEWGVQWAGGYLVGNRKLAEGCLVEPAPSREVWGPGGCLGGRHHRQGVEFSEGLNVPEVSFLRLATLELVWGLEVLR